MSAGDALGVDDEGIRMGNATVSNNGLVVIGGAKPTPSVAVAPVKEHFAPKSLAADETMAEIARLRAELTELDVEKAELERLEKLHLEALDSDSEEFGDEVQACPSDIVCEADALFPPLREEDTALEADMMRVISALGKGQQVSNMQNPNIWETMTKTEINEMSPLDLARQLGPVEKMQSESHRFNVNVKSEDVGTRTHQMVSSNRVTDMSDSDDMQGGCSRFRDEPYCMSSMTDPSSPGVQDHNIPTPTVVWLTNLMSENAELLDMRKRLLNLLIAATLEGRSLAQFEAAALLEVYREPSEAVPEANFVRAGLKYIFENVGQWEGFGQRGTLPETTPSQFEHSNQAQDISIECSTVREPSCPINLDEMD